MIVVSDTSPLNYLVWIGAIDVLPRLFGNIYVPRAVMLELLHPKTPPPVRNWAQSPPAWLAIENVSSVDPSLGNLGPGEAEAIALAARVGASALLIDERKGRRVAKERGLTTIGTITVLELAAQQKLLDLQAAFTALQNTTFQISPVLVQAALDRDAARKNTAPLDP